MDPVTDVHAFAAVEEKTEYNSIEMAHVPEAETSTEPAVSSEISYPTEKTAEIHADQDATEKIFAEIERIANGDRPPTRQAAINNCAIFQDRGTGTDLIELVRSYPELYDKGHPLYVNNSHKGVIWSKIAKDLNVGSAKKTREQFSYMRKRFKNEYLARKQGLKRPLLPEPDSSGYRQPLFVYEQMLFLESAIETDIANGFLNETDTCFSEDFKVKEEYDDIPKLDYIGNFVDMLPPLDIHSPGRKRKTPGMSSAPSPAMLPNPSTMDISRKGEQQQLVSNIMKQFRDSQNLRSTGAEDECHLFGKQVAIDLKGLNMKHRAVARYQINKVLMELLLEERGFDNTDLL